MPRLSRELVAERETFANAEFKTGKNVDQVQVAIAAKYNGVKMNPYRLKELFDKIQGASVPVESAVSQCQVTEQVKSVSVPVKSTAPKAHTMSAPKVVCYPPAISSTEGFMKIHDLIEAINSGKIG